MQPALSYASLGAKCMTMKKYPKGWAVARRGKGAPVGTAASHEIVDSRGFLGGEPVD